MHITAANSGDLLCLYQTGKRVKVVDVSEGFVTFQHENGEHFASRETRADAFIERDPARISSFESNCRLGQALNAAESKALEIALHTSASDVVERNEANCVLSIVQAQKAALEQRLRQEQTREIPGQDLARCFLDNLYEMGTGSHDTFFGRRVENLSQFDGSFSVNGQRLSYHDALRHLSSGMAASLARKTGLDAIIANADKRREAERVSDHKMNRNPFER